jgi:hypothetical protein
MPGGAAHSARDCIDCRERRDDHAELHEVLESLALEVGRRADLEPRRHAGLALDFDQVAVLERPRSRPGGLRPTV